MVGPSLLPLRCMFPLVVAWQCVNYVSAAVCQVPDGVENLLVWEVRPRWAQLEWQHSPLAAICADHYTVTWCVLSSRWSTNCNQSSLDLPLTTISHNVTGLQPCSFYRLGVTTVNKKGTSVQVSDVIITPAEDLGPVQRLEVSVSGNQLAVIWDAPESSQACVSRYEVCWSKDGAGYQCSWTEMNLWLSGEVKSQQCATYNVSVRAQDVTNYTSPEATQSFQAGAGRVQSMNASHVTSQSVLLTWDSSTTSASCVAGYKVTWCHVDLYSGLCLQPAYNQSLSRGDVQYNVTGLQPCHEYRMSMVAVSEDGSESEGVETWVKTSLDEFLAPRNLSVSVVNSELTFVYFSPAEDSGQCTARYSGCLREEDSPGSSEVCLPAANDQYWTTWDNNTKPCTSYTLRLTAFSSDNHTSNTTSVSFTSGAADASDLGATNVTTNSSAVSVKLSWKADPLNNKCVQYQQVSWTAEGKNWSSSANVSNNARDIVLEDLEPCTKYEAGVVQLAAVSSSEVYLFFYSGSNVTSVSNLSAAGSGPDTVVVSFFAAEASPVCVANYSVCWRPSEGSQRQCGTLTATGRSSVNVGSLQSCTNYTVDVAPVGPDNRPYQWSTVVVTTTGCPTSAAARWTVSTTTWILLVSVWYRLAAQQ